MVEAYKTENFIGNNELTYFEALVAYGACLFGQILLRNFIELV
jgi:hypothetical protein